MIQLPKWPTLLVTGDKITPEQADRVIIRTTRLGGIYSSSRKWDSDVKKLFAIRSREKLWRVPSEEWETVARRVGSLDLRHLSNERIRSSSVIGPNGWCDWDGRIGCAGISLTEKWPEVEEVDKEWSKIAHNFPFLRLTAQLVHEEWEHSPSEWSTRYTPLVAWDVRNGTAELRSDPGALLFPPQELWETPEDASERVQRLAQPGSEIGVSVSRLRNAVRRCERDATKGK